MKQAACLESPAECSRGYCAADSDVGEGLERNFPGYEAC